MEIKREIKVSEVVALLDAGKSREEIGTELGLTRAEVTALFKHPSLKGKKAKKQLDFVVVDDTSDVALETQEEAEIPTEEPQRELQDSFQEESQEEQTEPQEEIQEENPESVDTWENSANVSLWEN